MKNIALALGQIEEAIGMVEDAGTDATPGLYVVLVRARDFLLQARGALWKGIVSFIAGFVIVVVFALMVIDALPGPGP